MSISKLSANTRGMGYTYNEATNVMVYIGSQDYWARLVYVYEGFIVLRRAVIIPANIEILLEYFPFRIIGGRGFDIKPLTQEEVEIFDEIEQSEHYQEQVAKYECEDE